MKRPKYYIPTNPLPKLNNRELLFFSALVLNDVTPMEMLYIDGHPLDQIIKRKLGLPINEPVSLGD